MNRILELQYKYLNLIKAQEEKDIHDEHSITYRDEPLDWERIHMASSARIAYELALERNSGIGCSSSPHNVNPELAACAAAIHDIGRVLTGKQDNHAENGYEPAREFLTSIGIFSETEINELALAVKNHSRKSESGTQLEEIVKDADVIDCYHLGLPFDRSEKEVRYKKWLNR